MPPTRRLLFVTNHAAFFASHRLPIAREARCRGYAVSLLTGRAGSAAMEQPAVDLVAAAGIAHCRVGFSAAGMNPLREAWELWRMYRIVRRLRPDIVHCASPKGVLYGGIVARLAGVPAVVLSISGLGYAFTGEGPRGLRRRLAAAAYRLLFGVVLKHPAKRVVVQNSDDAALMRSTFSIADAELELIPGSGVDLEPFRTASPAAKQPIVLFPARLLRDKGAVEFLTAASHLKPANPGWRFLLAGAADYRNPSALGDAELQHWRAMNHAELLGHQHDMVPWYLAASIVCLPSHREGMPKALLEAAAAGCAVVTTNVAGCREAVIASETADLVPVGNVEALAAAVAALIADEPRRRRYGEAGRVLAGERFDIRRVIARTLELYDDLLRQREVDGHGRS